MNFRGAEHDAGGLLSAGGRWITRALLCGVVSVAVVLGAAAGTALAAAPPETLYVTIQGGDPTCLTPAGCADIQGAIDRAYHDELRGAASSVTIDVGPGTFDQQPGVFGEIPSVSIVGSGVGTTIIRGSQSGSVLTVASGDDVSVSNLTITNGAAANGGGIYNDGNLTLDHVSVTLNEANGTSSATGVGGGVYSDGTLTATDSTFSGNESSNSGGGIASVGNISSGELPSNTLSLTDDAIWGNEALAGTGAGPAYVEHSGGGILLDDSLGNSFEGDTIAGNDAFDSLGFGGAIALVDAGVALSGDTIADNHAAYYGGISNFGGELVPIAGTIVARNSGIGGSCGVNSSTTSPYQDEGFNLGDGPQDISCGFSRPSIGTGLGPLADNGGPTDTEAITSASPAYDAIPASDPLCAGTDQRGVARIQRGAGACDIGAYQVDAPSLYVANPGGQSITAYATGADDNAAPVLTLSGQSTGLSRPRGVVVDVTGKVYVANNAGNSITEYAPEVTGNASPVDTIAGTLTKLNGPQGLALDSSGDLWVSNGGGSVLEFAPGASGNAKPRAVISGARTRLHDPQGVSFDAAGALYVSNSDGLVTSYARGAHGDVVPLRRIGAGSLTAPEGLNLDAAGNLLVADASANRVARFAATATAPSATISGSATGLDAPVGLDLDSSDDLFVANSAADSITEYPADWTAGSPSPVATISGAATGLSDPAFLSELPPPPAPRVRVNVARRIAVKKLLRDRRLMVGVTARGRLAFHSGSLTVTVTARLHRRTIADVKATFFTAGHRTLELVLTPRDRRDLRRTNAKRITITVVLRDGAGAQRKHITVQLQRHWMHKTAVNHPVPREATSGASKRRRPARGAHQGS